MHNLRLSKQDKRELRDKYKKQLNELRQQQNQNEEQDE